MNINYLKTQLLDFVDIFGYIWLYAKLSHVESFVLMSRLEK